MFRIGAKKAPWRGFVARADAARDAGRYREAAGLYEQALSLNPDLGGIHVQAGHMRKEAGAFGDAERHYTAASRLMPDSAEIALQFGHLYKTTGRLAEAGRAYRRALELEPGWAAAETELAAMHASGWVAPIDRIEASRAQPVITLDDLGPEGRPDDLKLAGLYGALAPELLPRMPREMLRHSRESVALRQFGVLQKTFWGDRKVARGIEAIRGVAISRVRLTTVHATVNDLTIYRGTLKGPFELEYEPDKARIHKYAFNIWADFSDFAPGLYELGLRFAVSGAPDIIFTDDFVVEAPLLEADHPNSDGVITLDDDGTGSLDERIMARPAVIHDAERANQLGAVNRILLLRVDQLGDMVTSIPAIARVRELFPEARLAGLVSAANIDLARTLGLFDELIEIDFPERWHQRARTLGLAEQQAIRDRLEPYKFDLAVDLAVSTMSRPLLALTGARLTYGFDDPSWHRLSANFASGLFDPKNGRESASHSSRVLGLIDRLGSLSRTTLGVIRRDDLSRERLRAFGIGEEDRFAVLHSGARIVWSRWAHYPELAERLLRDTDLKIVLFPADRAMRDALPPSLRESDRVIIIDGMLPFDDLDALLSFCSLYVGNDSGPKHLASLRGVPVVSIHSARINWSEWGQEHSGAIVSRKVPCAGCTVYHDPDECGKDYACMKIGLDEVYEAVRRYV